ncbi:MAG: hypothetical protein BMS9Abin05_0967 [Rhodothermia bacterium]|nr:MAG: hypothetical protein BMS9Abin05_0967 [Rhodothermia bacterium]
MRRSLLCVALLSLLFGACDGAGVSVTPTIDLTPLQTVEVSNGRFSIRLDDRSTVGRSRWLPEPGNPDLWVSTFSLSGLWLAADQGPYRSNVGSVTPNAISSFEFASTETENIGIFVITKDSLESEILNWPVELGAPVEADGTPQIYGDLMAWAAYQPATAPGVGVTSLSGVRVGVSLFMFVEEPLSNALFIRYDIRNTSNETLSDLHIGYGADTDLLLYERLGIECGRLAWNENQTGYDLDNHVTYTYVTPHPEDGSRPRECYATVVGFSILDMSSPNGLGGSKMAHRILREKVYDSYPEFATTEITNSEHLRLALEGLSPSGDQMIDPTTGSPSRFAFTGDPVSKTGWLDQRIDVLSVQSITPIDLAPGDERSITVAWLIAKGQNFETGLELFREQFDQIMSRRDLWDF